MEFNSREFNEFRMDFKKAVEELEKKYNVSVNLGNINYTESEFTSKVTVKKIDTDGSLEKEEFEKYCHLYGFKPEDYKAQFKSGARTFELIGFNLRNPKNCCSMKCLNDGKTYKGSDEIVKRALGR